MEHELIAELRGLLHRLRGVGFTPDDVLRAVAAHFGQEVIATAPVEPGT